MAKTAQAIDAVIDRHDPAALRRTRAGARGRDVVITPADDQSGTAALWGSLFATDATVLDRRLNQMAHQVCDDDPRTLAQRRADALGALAVGAEQLACGCGTPGCAAALDTDPRAAAVMIHVVADAAALNAHPDPHTSGEPAPRPITPDTPLHEALAPDPEPPAPVALPAAHVIGGGTVPAPLVAELIRDGAKVRPLRNPADAPLESGYRPPIGRAGAVHPVPGYDLSVSGLRSTRRVLRHRSHRPPPARADPPVESQVPMQKAPPSENLLDRLV